MLNGTQHDPLETLRNAVVEAADFVAEFATIMRTEAHRTRLELKIVQGDALHETAK